MLGGPLTNRWKHQCKPGQAVDCRIVGRTDGGYTVQFGTQGITGFLPSNEVISAGTHMLLQFVGYKNQVAVFNPVYGLPLQNLQPR